MPRRAELIVAPCGCGGTYPVVCPAGWAGREISCPWSSQRMRVRGHSPFGAAEWAACGDSRALRGCLSALGLRPSQRKLRLATCGLARVVYDWCRNTSFLAAVEYAEAIADGLPPAGDPDAIRQGIEAHSWAYAPDWAELALACLAVFPPEHFSAGQAAYPGIIADVTRELHADPFIAIDWRREWLTSTAVGLARAMYESRDFSPMPILADALQDAGCDDAAILTHCRGTSPHARGCWVLDALLGKS